MVLAITNQSFFVFFMINDPGTTVKNRKGQMLVAFLVSPIAMVLHLQMQKRLAIKPA